MFETSRRHLWGLCMHWLSGWPRACQPRHDRSHRPLGKEQFGGEVVAFRAAGYCPGNAPGAVSMDLCAWIISGFWLDASTRHARIKGLRGRGGVLLCRDLIAGVMLAGTLSRARLSIRRWRRAMTPSVAALRRRATNRYCSTSFGPASLCGELLDRQPGHPADDQHDDAQNSLVPPGPQSKVHSGPTS